MEAISNIILQHVVQKLKGRCELTLSHGFDIDLENTKIDIIFEFRSVRSFVESLREAAVYSGRSAKLTPYALEGHQPRRVTKMWMARSPTKYTWKLPCLSPKMRCYHHSHYLPPFEQRDCQLVGLPWVWFSWHVVRRFRERPSIVRESWEN